MPTNNTKSAVKKQQPEVPDKPSEKTKKLGMLDIEDRNNWIEESAYFMAENRGFIPGLEKKDWEAAEKKYDTHLSSTS